MLDESHWLGPTLIVEGIAAPISDRTASSRLGLGVGPLQRLLEKNEKSDFYLKRENVYLTDKRVISSSKRWLYLLENKPFYKGLSYSISGIHLLHYHVVFRSLSQADDIVSSLQHCRNSLPPKTRCQEHVMHITFNA